MDLNDFDLSVTVRPTNPRILLDAGPPKALYKVNPRLILGEEWWNAKRKKAYSDFMNCCAACGVSYVKLEAHELYTVDKRKGKIFLRDIVPLCGDCHSFVHQDLHKALIKKGAMKFSEVQRILERGKAILRKHKIYDKRKNPNDSSVPFENWRLVLGGKEYAPIFENNERG